MADKKKDKKDSKEEKRRKAEIDAKARLELKNKNMEKLKEKMKQEELEYPMLTEPIFLRPVQLQPPLRFDTARMGQKTGEKDGNNRDLRWSFNDVAQEATAGATGGPSSEDVTANTGVDKSMLMEQMLAGTIKDHTGRRWRVLGMRPQREENVIATDYDVFRMPREWKVGEQTITERRTYNKNDFVMRICRYDDEKTQNEFLHEHRVLKELLASVHHGPHRDMAAEIAGAGKFRPVLVNGALGGKLSHLNLRPYFIMEKVGLPLDYILLALRDEFMPVPTASFLTIGVVKALRQLHQLGYVHTNVQPSCFSVRLGPNGMLNRKESELCGLVVITSCWLAKKNIRDDSQKKVPGQKETKEKKLSGGLVTFRSNYMFCSYDMMRFKEPTVVDDCVSAMNIFLYFTMGQLPWCPRQKHMLTKSEIETIKHSVEETGTYELFKIRDDGVTKEAQPRKDVGSKADYLQAMKIIRNGNGTKNGQKVSDVPYLELIRSLFATALAAVEKEEKDKDKKATQSIFGYQQKLIVAYRFGFEKKDGGPVLPNERGKEKLLDAERANHAFTVRNHGRGKNGKNERTAEPTRGDKETF